LPHNQSNWLSFLLFFLLKNGCDASRSLIFKSITMTTFQLNTHRPGRTYATPHFFILSKGNNSGKPLTTPCPNCFVMQLTSDADKEHFYWLTYALFRSRAFEQFLRGSVIPFVVLPEVRNLIRQSFSRSAHRLPQLTTVVQKVQALDRLQIQYREQLQHLEQAKVHLVKSYFQK